MGLFMGFWLAAAQSDVLLSHCLALKIKAVIHSVQNKPICLSCVIQPGNLFDGS